MPHMHLWRCIAHMTHTFINFYIILNTNRLEASYGLYTSPTDSIIVVVEELDLLYLLLVFGEVVDYFAGVFFYS